LARALIVGCGCRGRLLGERWLEEGWAVRGTSRCNEGLAVIEDAGIEPALADPDRPATLLELVADVTVIYWLLGSAMGTAEQVEAIHGPRLERFLEHLVETPVRCFVYEAAGTVEVASLREGTDVVRAAGTRWQIPVEIVTADPGDAASWLKAHHLAVQRVLVP
jgi:uncharacterized protein YbjT (DUF2867 family)